jgi:adenine-specific DNA methylase
MSRIFVECQKVLRKNEGRLVLSFHHWDPRAWSALATALRKARFRLQEFHIVHSENPTSVHIANMRSLTDDAILFLAPQGREVRQRWKRPAEVSYKNSAAFCQGCAALLGWMLDSELEESQISEIWNQMLLAR